MDTVWPELILWVLKEVFWPDFTLSKCGLIDVSFVLIVCRFKPDLWAVIFDFLLIGKVFGVFENLVIEIVIF